MSQFKSILPKGDPSRKSRRAWQESENTRETRNVRYAGNRSGHKQERNFRNDAVIKARGTARGHKKKTTFNRSSVGVLALLALLLIILIPTALTLRSTSHQLSETKAMQSSLEAQREALQASVNDLKSQLEIVNTDHFLEKYAHEKLGMLRPNEILMEMKDGQVKVNEEALAKYRAQQSNQPPASQSNLSEEATGTSDQSAQGYGTTAPAEERPVESSQQ